MLEAAAKHVDAGRPAMMVGTGDGVNVPPTVTAVVLAAGVIGGLIAVLTVLICCRYCCADARHPAATSMLKRFLHLLQSIVFNETE